MYIITGRAAKNFAARPCSPSVGNRKKDKSFTRFFSKNRGFQRQSLWSPAAAGEIPHRPKAPSADGAIPGQRPWSAPPPLRGGRRGPSTNAVPDTVLYSLDVRWYTPAALARSRPTGVESIGPSGAFWRTPTGRAGIGLGQNLLCKTVCGPFTFVQFVKISFDFFVPH